MEKLIPIGVVEEHTGLKKSSIYKRIQEGTFPKPIKLGHASRWQAGEISKWISDKIEAQRVEINVKGEDR